jgi:hypothetical protein
VFGSLQVQGLPERGLGGQTARVDVIRMLLGCFDNVSRMLLGCFDNVIRMLFSNGACLLDEWLL